MGISGLAIRWPVRRPRQPAGWAGFAASGSGSCLRGDHVSHVNHASLVMHVGFKMASLREAAVVA